MPQYYVLMVNQTGTDDSVIFKLKTIDSVKFASGVFGPYDIIAKLESPNDATITQDISNRIRKIPQIRSTLTLEVNPDEGFVKTSKIENEILEKHMAQAFVIIHCNRSSEKEIIQSLSNIPEVIETNVLVGSYEILSKIVAPTYNDISEIIGNKIRKLEIKSTITLNVVANQGFSK